MAVARPEMDRGFAAGLVWMAASQCSSNNPWALDPEDPAGFCRLYRLFLPWPLRFRPPAESVAIVVRSAAGITLLPLDGLGPALWRFGADPPLRGKYPLGTVSAAAQDPAHLTRISAE